MPLLSNNPLWEAFGERALLYAGSSGADFGECLVTVQAVGDQGGPDDWHREWTCHRRASCRDRLRERAAGPHDQRARGVSARLHLPPRRLFSHCFGSPVDPRLITSFQNDSECFRRAAELAPYPLEPIEILWSGGSMPGYFACPDHSDAPRPTIVQTNGYDSNVHEMFFGYAAAALRRGYNWIGFDGPGQGRNLICEGQPLRPGLGKRRLAGDRLRPRSAPG